MANNNNHNNEGKVTAGELFEKLRGSNGASAAPSGSSGQQPVGVAADEEPAALGFSEDIFSEEVLDNPQSKSQAILTAPFKRSPGKQIYIAAEQGFSSF